MGNEDYSPDPEITIRTPGRPLPTFSGLALPSPLRELYKHHGDTSTTPHPSEFTALANRFQSIRLDISPTADNTSAGPEVVQKPTKLDFGEDAEDKENVENRSPLDAAKARKTPKRIDKGSLRESPKLRPVENESLSSETDFLRQLQGDAPSSAQDDHIVGKLDIEEENIAIRKPVSPSRTASLSSAEKEAETADSNPVQKPHHQADATSFSAEEDALEVAQEVSSSPQENLAENESTAHHSDNSDLSNPADGHTSINDGLKEHMTADIENDRQSNEEISTSPAIHIGPEKEKPSERPSVNIATEPVQFKPGNAERDPGQSTFFSEQLQILLGGKEKWSWPKRCEAMTTVSQTLSGSPCDEDIATVRQNMPLLSNAVNDNLDELRPSIINSALRLINSILTSKADTGSDFAEDVFSSVMDISCGRSLTAREAARSVSVILHFHPSLSNILEDADNPDRLIELLQLDVDEEHVLPDTRDRAQRALPLVRKVFDGEEPSVPSTPQETIIKPRPVESPDSMNEPATPVQSRASDNSSTSGRKDSVTSGSAEKTKSSLAARLKKVAPSSDSDLRTPRQHRFSERLGPISSSEFKATQRQSLRANLADIRLNTPVVRNKKLGNSIRKISPLSSSRKKRTYTEEDIEEARSAAIRVVMEESSQREAKLRAEHQKERNELEKKYLKEQSFTAELQTVLKQYEDTMQKMISQGNSQASAYCTSLEKETKRLKAELLEVTEAYESVKERYDSTKQSLKVYENKETRFIEQIRTLKKNLTELQKWSNDLKANCEKKLTNAFSQVTTFRASYMEVDAHRNKAIADLERTQTELTKAISDRAEIAEALSRLEKSLHEEQDKTSSLDTSLSSVKDSLQRVTTQKNRLEGEVSATHKELKKATSQLSELEDAKSRADHATQKLEKYTSERQSLKARAYDDLTKIRELENELDVKDKEYQELNNLCEEALSQLEKMKLQK